MKTISFSIWITDDGDDHDEEDDDEEQAAYCERRRHENEFMSLEGIFNA